MHRRILLLAAITVLTLALWAQTAVAQEDDLDDEGAAAPAQQGAPLPDTGGPAVLPALGAALVGLGTAGALLVRKRRGR